MGDYFFPPVNLHALENFKEFFDDRVMQFYSKLNWKITSSYNNGLCFYPAGTLVIHLKDSRGSNASWRQSRKLGEIVGLVKEGGTPSQRAMVHLLSSPRNKYIDFLNLPKQEGDRGLTLRNTPWQSSFMKPGTDSVL